MKKYELTNNTITQDGVNLYQIRALKDFANVKKGDLGGYIEKKDNLSQLGNAWIYDIAWVSGNAWIYDSAWVSGNAKVFENARVYGDAWVCGDARVF